MAARVSGTRCHKVGQFLVGAVPVAHQPCGVAERPPPLRCARDRGTVDRVPADTDPQPGAARSAWMRQDVSSPWRNRASRWCARMAAESGSNSGARRRAPSASVPAEIASPWPVSQSATRLGAEDTHGARTGRAHTLRACSRTAAPPAAPRLPAARRRRSQPRRQRGRSITRRLDRHLDQFRRVGAVRHIRFPAIGGRARPPRGCELPRAFRDPAWACGHGRRHRPVGRADGPTPPAPGARSCARTAPWHAPPDSREASQAPPRAPRCGFAGSRPPCATRRSCSACAHPRPPPPAAASAARPRRAAKAAPAPRGEPPSSARAAVSLSRPISNCRRQNRALARQSISPRRHSSARRLSRSNSDCQGSPDVGADSPPREGRTGPSSRTGAGIVRTCAGTDMRTKITHVERCYQPSPSDPRR